MSQLLAVRQIFLRQAPERFRNREVYVSINGIEEKEWPAPDGFTVMLAHTGRQGEFGGSILIFFPEHLRDQVLQFYAKPQSGQTKVIFYNFQGEDVLVVPRKPKDEVEERNSEPTSM